MFATPSTTRSRTTGPTVILISSPHRANTDTAPGPAAGGTDDDDAGPEVMAGPQPVDTRPES